MPLVTYNNIKLFENDEWLKKKKVTPNQIVPKERKQIICSFIISYSVSSVDDDGGFLFTYFCYLFKLHEVELSCSK